MGGHCHYAPLWARGEIGRRSGLKSGGPERGVRVQVPPGPLPRRNSFLDLAARRREMASPSGPTSVA